MRTSYQLISLRTASEDQAVMSHRHRVLLRRICCCTDVDGRTKDQR